MTLLIRLLMVGLLGLGLFFGYIKWGEPTLRAMQAEGQSGSASGSVPQEISRLYGKYTASNSNGRYVLTLDGSGAELRFTDNTRQDYAYRGHYTVDGNSLEVAWAEQRTGSGWASMQTVADKMKVMSADTIAAAEGTFSRVKK
ncbi:hypothetical protein WT12_08285 [Burkholderia territorii]|uniref:hypothetical protein n=1 Tax=Burkholderia territorii TaxID=1503055 RepID=UPI000759C6B8|nr:hypothetical protein [Burkholderia territorii]KVN48735.1 hypothetical protein WT12_08285 [Burkholderia territorii]